jgi:hypothetical protein
MPALLRWEEGEEIFIIRPCAPFQDDVLIRCDYRVLSDLSQPLRDINDFHCLAIYQRNRPASPLCAMVRKGYYNKLLLHMPADEVDTSAITSAVLDSSTQVRTDSVHGGMGVLKFYDDGDLRSLPSGIWGIKVPTYQSCDTLRMKGPYILHSLSNFTVIVMGLFWRGKQRRTRTATHLMSF